MSHCLRNLTSRQTVAAKAEYVLRSMALESFSKGKKVVAAFALLYLSVCMAKQFKTSKPNNYNIRLYKTVVLFSKDSIQKSAL